jgi:hypothetical protein
MRGPRIVKVSCPHCGAPVAIDPWSAVWTCTYCRNRSYVHRPNAPIPQFGAESYGHIHVPPRAMRKALLLLVVLIVGPVLVIAGLILVVALVAVQSRRSSSTYFIPATPSSPLSVTVLPDVSNPGWSMSSGATCQKWVRCCKAVSAASSGCESMAMLSEQICAQNLPALEAAARALGKRCD